MWAKDEEDPNPRARQGHGAWSVSAGFVLALLENMLVGWESIPGSPQGL